MRRLLVQQTLYGVALHFRTGHILKVPKEGEALEVFAAP
jgi:hypothetical protein